MVIPKLGTYGIPQRSEMPSNKVDWQVDPSKAALLIHDMQDYFLDFWGEPNEFTAQLIANIKSVRSWCKENGIPVYYTAQPKEQSSEDRALLNDMWGPGITQRPERVSIVSELAPEHDDIVLTKHRYSAFHRSSLERYLTESGKTQLIIAGIYGHIGCYVTAVDAFMRDIKPFVVADAIGDFSLAKHLTAMELVARTCGMVILKEDLVKLAPSKKICNKSELRSIVLGLLDDEEEPENDENLVDYGLDSLKIMSLASKLKKTYPSVDFVKLAQESTIDGWWALLQN